jgi:hypothetical protein
LCLTSQQLVVGMTHSSRVADRIIPGTLV